MEKEGLGREIEIYNEPADRETEPLLPLTPPAAPYEKFRVGREPQQLKRWIMPALFALKVSFWSLGMRGYRVWKYITYTLLVIVCAYYGFFKVYCADNPLQPCPLRKMEERTLYHAYQVAYISNLILAMASILSCLAFIGCCMVGKRKTLALMCPSAVRIKEIDQVNLFMLFLAFLTMIVLLTTSVIFASFIDPISVSRSVINWTDISKALPVNWTDISKALPVSGKVTPAGNDNIMLGTVPQTELVSHNSTCKLVRLSTQPDVPLNVCKAFSASEDSTQFFLHFVSLNICHIFAAVCMVLGTFAEDTLRLIRDVHITTLDDVIRMHDDLCTVVSRTASAFSVWFLLHWISYGTGCILLMIRFCVEIQLLLESEEYKAIPMSVASHALLLLFYLYLFVFPCVIAAGISGNCAEIYEKVNCSTSDDWNEGHPFKDRNNISLFVSYAEKRRCGFKAGRITFDAALAWVSFLLGVIAALFPLIQHGYFI